VCREPVRDDCGYDQSLPRRIEDSHPVTDLMLSLRLLKLVGRGSLVVRATDGREEFQVRIQPQAGRYQVIRRGDPLPVGRGKLPAHTRGMLLEVSLFDQQFLMAFDGHTVVAQPYERPPSPPQPSCEPFAIGCEGLGVMLGDLRLYRDTYYTHPVGLRDRPGLDAPCRLRDNEYYVLGDNSPISDDSRTWPQGPAVDGNLLIGKPLLAFSWAQKVLGRGRAFWVPDFSSIRYIRR
jgi:signal peptidase I